MIACQLLAIPTWKQPFARKSTVQLDDKAIARAIQSRSPPTEIVV
jgi:hypothetical protein